MVAATAMLAYPITCADTPRHSEVKNPQVGIHVDRAWRDHPGLTAQRCVRVGRLKLGWSS